MTLPHELDSQWISEALSLNDRPPVYFQSLTTDSRKIKTGSLFIAIVGEKMDGHSFITSAVQMGATGIVAQKGKVPTGLPQHIVVFEVEDTTEAFRQIAKVWRNRFSIPVICVAGSVGKTTTKEILASILRGKYEHVVNTQGSQNGYLGIPMTLMDITPQTEIAVIEVGIDEIGAMKKHIDLVSPTLSLLTTIGPEHLEKLKDLETVTAEESLALSMTAAHEGITIAQLDDPCLKDTIQNLSNYPQLWCSHFVETGTQDTLPDFKIPHLIRGEWNDHDPKSSQKIRVTTHLGASFDLSMPVQGKHNARNLLLATTAALALDLSPIEIQRGLSTFQGAYGRSELKMLPRNTAVLCDYYNANPSSVEAGIDLLSQIAKQNKTQSRWIILGDMLELGDLEEKLHRDLADKITLSHPAGVLLYGPRMKWLQQELIQRGFKGKLAHLTTHESLVTQLLAWFNLGDALLIKGSRGMKMEEVWKLIEPQLKAMGTA
jgi:UDP-N-acetylmuramoyl-tripeptide--D-alanyl-D-alanine ligase